MREGRSPAALLPVLELWSHLDHASPGVTESHIERLGRSRRLSPAVRTYVRGLGGVARIRAGDVEGATETFDALGYVTRWRILGPFDNEGKAGFDREMPPEADLDGPRDLEGQWQGRERSVRWRTYPAISRFGYVNFDAVLRPYENVCGFAETFVRSDRAEALSLWVGAGGASKVWFNGEEVLTDPTYRGPDWDRAVAIVPAREGWNRVLVKTCVTDGLWGFYLRFGAPDGSPRSLDADPDGAEVAAPAPERAPRLPPVPDAPLAWLEARVAEDPEDAEAHLQLAQLLTWTDAYDPAEQRPRELAERSCELAPTVEACLLVAGTSEERSERMRWTEAAAEADPDAPRVLLMRAALRMGGPEPAEAFDLLDRIPDRAPESLAASMARAGLYRDLGLEDTASRIAADARARSGGAATWVGMHRDALERGGQRDAALEATRDLLELRYDDTDARKTLLHDALERGETDRVLRHLEALRELSPDSADVLYYAATIYDGLGMEDEALDVHRQAIALAPEDSYAHVAYGQALLRQGKRDAAAAALREALALRPQDAGTRELLEHIRPAERPDEAWATDTEAILARRREGDGWPVTILHDLRVNSVYDNGLGSTFRQVVAQVHDDEGARRWRSYSIPYEPGSQWVDVRLARVHRDDGVLESIRTHERNLSDARYRIYYDRRALVVTFPDLEPGDVVELRYRVDDVAHRNVFDDYFGDMQVLQGAQPIAHLEYVLLTPPSRDLYFNEPEMQGLRHERRVDGNQRVDRFVVEDVPALRSEPNMPGITELAPYLHVSTYRTWEDVGEWWWGLIDDQLHMDESLRETVAELVEDAPDTETKVERIFGWVVKNTRYVGLEFGIHGYKPYRVTQVVRRGFGDCKDKASLLYVMLEEAGIDARIVLVRTRRNGSIESQPASLAAFDHAIAYVPDLDLYLDGTAENSGSTELPAQDQGVTVLVVGPDGAELRQTPVLPAERGRRERDLTVELEADGAATVKGVEVVRGHGASGYRTTYQAVSTREERLQRQLGGNFPGLELLEQSFGDLEDLETPVRFEYRARVPQLAQRDRDVLRVAPSAVEELASSLAPSPRRRHPVDLGSRTAYRERRTIELQPGMTVGPLPEGGAVESPFGRLVVQYETRGREVTVTTDLEIRAHRVAPADYYAFRRWLQDADRLLRQRITIEAGGEA